MSLGNNNAPRAGRVRDGFLAGVAALSLGALVLTEVLPASAQPAADTTTPATTSSTTPDGQALNAAPLGETGIFSFADIVEQVSPAVVSITVETVVPAQQLDLPPGFEDFFDQFGLPDQGQNQLAIGQGSGFFISSDGYIVTNNHVVAGASMVQVDMEDGSTYQATVIGTDPATDLALVKVDADRDFPFVSLAQGDIRVGDWVVAVGNPFGLGGSVTAGIVSALGRDIGAGRYDDFIQIDAPINRGNSGGPAFNTAGEVVGVNTAIYSPSGGSVGIAFAIPAHVVQDVVDDLRDGGQVVRGWLGVSISTVTPAIAEALGLDEARGALVQDPQPDSPAAMAGVHRRDVILSVNGTDIDDADELSRLIAGLDPGDQVALEIVRDGQTMTVNATLGTLDEAALDGQGENRQQPQQEEPQQQLQLENFGMELAPSREGVEIVAVDPAGPAARQGLSAGDLILEVGNDAVATPAEVQDAINAARDAGQGAVLMRIRSGNIEGYIALSFDDASGSD